ncbi:MAG: cadherin domain-containing protein, partial [Planctomycetes bacterium]|nr:cadherin domain-containing protein [Planctomycetota bacterium]
EFNVGAVTDSNVTSNNVDENASVGTVVQITALAADADATNNTITYSLQNDDGGRFQIDSVTGIVTVAGAIDREADGPSRTITVRATSSDGSFTDQNFTIAINDLDEFNVGTVSDTNATTNNVDENASVGTVVQITALAADIDATTNTITYSLQDNDGGRFAIDGVTGVVTVAGTIDREADGPTRNITVRATSLDGSFTDQAFAIAINDLDEFNVGTVSDTNATTNNVDENASIGTVVQITALAADIDATTNTVTYSLQDNDGGRFAIDSVTGVVTVAGAIDREADGPTRNITVRATSVDGSFTDQVFNITINDLDEFNVGAIVDANPSANIVQEHSPNGTVVPLTAFATDADATTNTISYSLTDDAQGRFAIDSMTGTVSVANFSLLRYELGPNYTITVRADSVDGSFALETFNLALDNLNDAPIAVDDSIDVTENHLQTLDVLANDFDLDPGDTLEIISANITSGFGSVTFDGLHIFYDPGTAYDYLSIGETALIEVAYEIEDSFGVQANAVVTLEIHGERDPLVLDSSHATSLEDNPFSWLISVTPVDINGEVLVSVTVTGLPTGTTIIDDLGSELVVDANVPSELYGFNLNQLYITLPEHVSGDFTLTIETTSTLGSISSQSLQRIMNIVAVADTPIVSANDARGQLGYAIPIKLDSTLVDVDGSERLRLELRGLPVGMTLTDGINKAAISSSTTWIDISDWNLSKLVLNSAGGVNGRYNIEFRSSATELANQNSISQSAVFELIVDEILPVSILSISETNSDSALVQFDSSEESSDEVKQYTFHTSHLPAGQHFEPLVVQIPNKVSSLFQQPSDNLSDRTLREDGNPGNQIPSPYFARNRAVSVEALAFEKAGHSDSILTENTEPADRSHDLRIENDEENLYKQSENASMLSSVNHTFLLAWTLVRSSISSLFAGSDRGSVEDRSLTSLPERENERSRNRDREK